MIFDAWDGITLTLLVTRVLIHFVNHGKPFVTTFNGGAQLGADLILFFLLWKGGTFV